jgi:hypothetical protein
MIENEIQLTADLIFKLVNQRKLELEKMPVRNGLLCNSNRQPD